MNGFVLCIQNFAGITIPKFLLSSYDTKTLANSRLFSCFTASLSLSKGSPLREMLRRNIRLRREYLYRKSLEGKERLLYEKKRKIKEALAGNKKIVPNCSKFCVYLQTDLSAFTEGKPIPTELRNEEAALRQEIDLEDEITASMHVFFFFVCLRLGVEFNLTKILNFLCSLIDFICGLVGLYL